MEKQPKKKSEFSKYPVEDKTILIIGYILLGLFLIAIILPMIYIILASFIDPVTLQNKGLIFDFTKWTLTAYERVLGNGQIWVGFKNALIYSILAEDLIDPEAFTQEWSTYVAKGKSGRYGVCFSWDVANIAQVNMQDLIDGKHWVPLPALAADTKNITPGNGSFTSGFDRGRCVITANAKNPALICSWLDQMYDPMQSPQNNWGTYGEDDDFDIFVMGKNADGEDMLQHAPLGDASPVEVREAEAVGGPLAILDSYYGKYVTCPDDAQYRLDWIKDIYTPDMNTKYVFPNVFMSTDDTKEASNLIADISKCINTFKANGVKDGFTDADWDKLQKDLEGYGLSKYLALHQKYLDAFYK